MRDGHKLAFMYDIHSDRVIEIQFEILKYLWTDASSNMMIGVHKDKQKISNVERTTLRQTAGND